MSLGDHPYIFDVLECELVPIKSNKRMRAAAIRNGSCYYYNDRFIKKKRKCVAGSCFEEEEKRDSHRHAWFLLQSTPWERKGKRNDTSLIFGWLWEAHTRRAEVRRKKDEERKTRPKRERRNKFCRPRHRDRFSLWLDFVSSKKKNTQCIFILSFIYFLVIQSDF